MGSEASFFRPRPLIWNRLAFSPTLKKNSSGTQGNCPLDRFYFQREHQLVVYFHFSIRANATFQSKMHSKFPTFLDNTTKLVRY